VTIAGGGFRTFTDDAGPATDAPLACPYGLAFDAAGNLFLADTGNNRVRMVDANGVISTVAGTGPVGWGLGSMDGEGGPATTARLGNPAGIAFDADGNLIIADQKNHRIRRVDADGIITTIAGDGGLYPPFGGDGGLAIDATLNDPQGIAIDPQGNIYFADTHNNRVRKIDRSGRMSTIAGTGELASFGDEGPAVDAAVAGPRAVAVDASGNVYVSEAVWDVFGSDPFVAKGLGNRVRRIDPQGIIHAFAGTGEIGFAGDGGPATEALLNGVNESFGLAVDAAGNVYIADSKNNRIRIVDTTGIITTFADGSH
jgi:sugar lactone lactonase YvrE